MKILFSRIGIPKDVNEGDVVILKDDYFFCFYYVSISECRLVEKVKSIKFIKGNVNYGIVFEYCDLKPRKGNKELLCFFRDVFKRKMTVKYLQNALDILLFKEDKWDVSLLQSIIYADEKLEEKVNKQSFVDFLDEQTKDFYNKQMDNGKSVSDAYRLTKASFPKAFAQSLKRFKAAYPEKSIYE